MNGREKPSLLDGAQWTRGTLETSVGRVAKTRAHKPAAGIAEAVGHGALAKHSGRVLTDARQKVPSLGARAR